MRRRLLSLIRGRADRDRESTPRPDDGYEHVSLDTSDEIIIDGVPMLRGETTVEASTGRPLRILIIVLAVVALVGVRLGYQGGLAERLESLWDELRQPYSNMPTQPDTRSGYSPQNETTPTDSDSSETRTKKNTY